MGTFVATATFSMSKPTEQALYRRRTAKHFAARPSPPQGRAPPTGASQKASTQDTRKERRRF